MLVEVINEIFEVCLHGGWQICCVHCPPQRANHEQTRILRLADLDVVSGIFVRLLYDGAGAHYGASVVGGTHLDLERFNEVPAMEAFDRGIGLRQPGDAYLDLNLSVLADRREFLQIAYAALRKERISHPRRI